MSGTLSIPGLVPDDSGDPAGTMSPQQAAMLQQVLAQNTPPPDTGPSIPPGSVGQPPPAPPQPPPQAPPQPPPQAPQGLGPSDQGVAADVGMGAPPLAPHQTPGLISQANAAPAPNVPPPGAQQRLQAAQAAQGTPIPPAPPTPPPAAPPAAPGAPQGQAGPAPSMDALMMKTLTAGGLSPAGAQGVVGRLSIESSGNPNALGDQGTSYGYAQWHNGRAAQLMKWAGDNHLNPTEPATQAEFTLWDLKTNYPQLYKQLQTTTDPAQAQQLFTQVYERPKVAGPASKGGAAPSPQDLADNSPSARLAAGQQAMQPGAMNMSFLNDPGFQQLAGMMRPTQSQQLMALASGLLEGPTFGAGLGKGIAAANELSTQGRQEMGQLANMGLQNQLWANRLNMDQQRLNQGQEKIDQNGQRIQLYGQSIDLRSPDAQAQIQARREMAKDANNDIDAMQEAGQNAPVKAQQIQAMQGLLNSGQLQSGPGVQQLKREIANYFGLDPATANQSGAMLASQIRGSGIMGKNMRTQKEFNTVMEGLPNIDTMNPQVLQQVVNGMSNLNKLQTNLYQNWNGMSSDQRLAMREDPDKYNQWFQQQTSDWEDKVQKQGGMYAPPGGASPGSPAMQSQNRSAAPTMRYDPQSKQMVPIGQ